MGISFKNWDKQSHPTLVTITGIVGAITILLPQILTFIHSAPFPVSDIIDLWAEWIMKGATLILTAFTIMSKRGYQSIQNKEQADNEQQ